MAVGKVRLDCVVVGRNARRRACAGKMTRVRGLTVLREAVVTLGELEAGVWMKVLVIREVDWRYRLERALGRIACASLEVFSSSPLWHLDLFDLLVFVQLINYNSIQT